MNIKTFDRNNLWKIKKIFSKPKKQRKEIDKQTEHKKGFGII